MCTFDIWNSELCPFSYLWILIVVIGIHVPSTSKYNKIMTFDHVMFTGIPTRRESKFLKTHST